MNYYHVKQVKTKDSKKTGNFLILYTNQKLKHEQKNILIHTKYQQDIAEPFP